MKLFSKIMIGFVAVLHVYIWVLEVFLWTTPYGMKTFGMTPEQAQTTATLALNQGFYNLVLAVGLFWTFAIKNTEWSRNVALFFLAAVAAMGVVGGLTAKTSILFIQALPALIGFVVTYLAGRGES